jgi:hypothetical protein
MMIKAVLMTSKVMGDEALFDEDDVSAFGADAGTIVLTAAGAAIVIVTSIDSVAIGVVVGSMVAALVGGTDVGVGVITAVGGRDVFVTSGRGVFVAGGGVG